MRDLWAKMPPTLRDIIIDVVGTFFTSLGIYNLTSQSGFLPGGVSGIALIIQHYIPQLPIGLLNLLINVPIIIFSWKYLGKKYLLRTLRTVVVMTIVMDFIAPLLPIYNRNQLLAAIFGGFFVGLGLAIIFMNNTCTGGVDLITMSMKKIHPHMSLGQIVLLIDGTIILCGGLVFGNVEAVFFGLIFAFVCTKTMDGVMYGSTSGKMALIITEDGLGLGNEIDRKVQRGATILQGKGAHTRATKEIVLCAMSRQQLPALRRVIKDYDPQALLIVLEYNEVFGTGFQSLIEQE